MSKDLNQCNFIGRLGQDPEIKYLPNGNAACNMSIAVGDDYKDKNTGQKVEQTEWVNLSVFGRLADVCGEYLRKGSKVFVSGKMRTRKWQDQNGNDRYTTEIVVNDMQMLDSATSNQGAQAQRQPQQGYQQPQQNQRPQQNSYQQARQGAQQAHRTNGQANNYQNTGLPEPDFDDD